MCLLYCSLIPRPECREIGSKTGLTDAHERPVETDVMKKGAWVCCQDIHVMTLMDTLTAVSLFLLSSFSTSFLLLLFSFFSLLFLFFLSSFSFSFFLPSPQPSVHYSDSPRLHSATKRTLYTHPLGHSWHYRVRTLQEQLDNQALLSTVMHL